MPVSLELAAIRIFFALGLAALVIVLGFVALLKQRTYLDAKSQKPIQIDVPLFGKNVKMKTNYPALAFLFVGFLLAIYVLQSGLPAHETEEWQVQGSFFDPNISDWDRAGTLSLFPPQYMLFQGQPVDQNGHFNLKLKLDKDLTFEKAVQTITYSHLEGDVVIVPQDEYSAYQKKDESSKL